MPKIEQRFLLIRHGESHANISPPSIRLYDARLTDALLTSTGEAQAKSMGRLIDCRLRAEGGDQVTRGFSPTLCMVSPFTRTLQTACHLTGQWQGKCKLVVDPNLREYYPRFIPEIVGRPQNWLRQCPILSQLELFPDLQWHNVPEGNAQWWAPTGRPEVDTVDLEGGKQRMVDFIAEMQLRPENDIVVVAHGSALLRAMRHPILSQDGKPAPEKEKCWGNCEARLCTWSSEDLGFVCIDHPDFPMGGLNPDGVQHASAFGEAAKL